MGSGGLERKELLLTNNFVQQSYLAGQIGLGSMVAYSCIDVLSSY